MVGLSLQSLVWSYLVVLATVYSRQGKIILTLVRLAPKTCGYRLTVGLEVLESKQLVNILAPFLLAIKKVYRSQISAIR